MRKNIKPQIRELTLENGLDYPNDEELLMMILGSGTKDFPIRSLAQKVNDVVDSTYGDELITRLKDLKGIGLNKALQVAAAIEYGRRKNECVGVRISNAGDLFPFVQNYSLKEKEHFICVTLNGNHEIIQINVISVGSINSSVVYPREIFVTALKDGAAAMILVHNHPSGNILPSKADVETTRKLMKASNLICIPILDHLIINSTSYFSFKEKGLLFTKDE